MVIAVLLTLLVGGDPASGQDDLTLDEARAQKEENLQRQADLAAELDVLNARSDEMLAALAGLNEALAAQEAEVAVATAALAEAEQDAATWQARAAESAAAASTWRDRAREGVVNAYVGSIGRRNDLAFGATSMNDLVKKQEFYDLVQGSYQDTIERYRGLLDEQQQAEEAARAAVDAAAAAHAELDAARAELESRRDSQARLKDALADEIAEAEGRDAELKAAEEELDQVIRDKVAAVSVSSVGSGGGGGSYSVSVGSASASGFVYPADGPITSYFGYRIHPILGYSRLHAGLDIGAPYGAPVWASKAGTVIFAGWNGGYGNCVMIAHDGGIVTLYGHMSELGVSEGSSVRQGTVIGWVGSTGASTGPHLHFETRVYDNPTDPLLFL